MDSLKNRVGIDVGGTFTDFVMFMPGADRLVSHKHPSVPSDPSRAVIQGLAELLEMTGTTPKQIGAIVHGTTIGLNAILQRNGARVALLVSQGFRDVLEVGRGRMPSSLNFHAVKESPLVPRDCVIEINARLDPQGNVLAAPTGAELERVRSEIRALAPDAVAVMVLHGYANAAFEERLVTSLSMHLPGVSFCSASSIWPEIREYERTLVACMNASIQPLMQRYFDRLEAGIASLSIEAPLFISTSNGGLVNLRTARARPVETLLSGPAAGVTAASRIAVAAGADHVVTFDMGGTSSDVAVASGGQPEFTTRTDIGGLPLILPTVAVEAIGAGGGSVVHVDAHGIIKVGPKSAGAFPGPVAYGQGGKAPTVTDCYLVIGILDPLRFFNGKLALDVSLARAALLDIATALGLDGPQAAEKAAWGALRVATAGMGAALRKMLSTRGLDPVDFTLLPYGGAGPTHASFLADEMEMAHVLIPGEASTLCAFGAVLADLRRDFIRSLRCTLDARSMDELRQCITALEDAGRVWVAEEKRIVESVSFQREVEMRYGGEAYDLKITLPDVDVTELDEKFVAECFHRRHEALYGFRDADAPLRIMAVRIGVIGHVRPVPLPEGAGQADEPQLAGRRQVFLHDGWHDVPVYDKATLGPGFVIAGPAIIEQSSSTVPVLPGWRAEADRHGNLRLLRAGQSCS